MNTSDAIRHLRHAGLPFTSDGQAEFVGFAPLSEASKATAAFLKDRPGVQDSIDLINRNGLGLLVSTESVCSLVFNVESWIAVENPRLAYALIMKGEGLDAVKPKIMIGSDCEIDATARIGCDGLSANYFPEKDTQVHTPHVGGVEISSHVRIGAFTVVERAAMGVTRIGKGSHIDNFVVVGHGVQVGKNCAISSNVTLCGQCTIADFARVGAGAVVRERVTIGAGAFVGMGSVVTKDVPGNAIVYGNPARIHGGVKPW